jgi:CheY-like chemotaxis protein
VKLNQGKFDLSKVPIPDEDNINLIEKNESKYFERSWFAFSIDNSNTLNKRFYQFVIIDDQKLVRENTSNLIRKVLQNMNIENFQILEGSDGIDLLNIVRNDTFGQIKAIFIDENMEYLNGSEAVSIVRKLEDKKKIKNYKIASVTAFDDAQTKENILKSGATTIISKPCTKSDITNVLSNYLCLH